MLEEVEFPSVATEPVEAAEAVEAVETEVLLVGEEESAVVEAPEEAEEPLEEEQTLELEVEPREPKELKGPAIEE